MVASASTARSWRRWPSSRATWPSYAPLRFAQHLDDPKLLAGDVGPGWEYYLDMLVAARAGAPQPSFADYYPAQRDYYLAQARPTEES